MGLLNPGALVMFAIVPALILAYLIRERPARVTVSSVIAFRSLRERRSRRVGGLPRPDWTFFVELLALSLAVLAVAGPYLPARQSVIAVVLDNSAAMQAKTAANQERLDRARRELNAMLASEDAGTQVAVYLVSPRPHQAKDGAVSLSEARSLVANAEVTDVPADSTALIDLLRELSSNPRFRKVVFASARALAPPTPAHIVAITVGDSLDNFAIGSFTLRRESFGSDTLHARLTIANFSTASKTLSVTITGDGRHLGAASANLGAGETGVIEFPALAPANVYRAELAPADALALDNVAYATSGAIKAVSILFVSPQAADASGLDTIPGVSVRRESPEAFTPKDFANFDLAIFEYSVPKELPAVNSLIVMPPPGDPVFKFSVEPAAPVQFTRWSPIDPLTESVNFRLLNSGAGEFFAVHPWMGSVVDGSRGGLLLRGEREGHRFVAAGFNPFPYLGKRNLPMSILTLNLLGYLAGVGANYGGYHTGQPWLVPAGVETVVLPSGRRESTRAGTLFTDDTQQGIYQLVGPGESKSFRAVNLADLAVSDLEDAPPLKFEAAAPGASIETVSEKVLLSSYVFDAILALLVLEALLLYRRRRRREAAV